MVGKKTHRWQSTRVSFGHPYHRITSSHFDTYSFLPYIGYVTIAMVHTTLPHLLSHMLTVLYRAERLPAAQVRPTRRSWTASANTTRVTDLAHLFTSAVYLLSFHTVRRVLRCSATTLMCLFPSIQMSFPLKIQTRRDVLNVQLQLRFWRV